MLLAQIPKTGQFRRVHPERPLSQPFGTLGALGRLGGGPLALLEAQLSVTVFKPCHQGAAHLVVERPVPVVDGVRRRRVPPQPAQHRPGLVLPTGRQQRLGIRPATTPVIRVTFQEHHFIAQGLLRLIKRHERRGQHLKIAPVVGDLIVPTHQAAGERTVITQTDQQPQPGHPHFDIARRQRQGLPQYRPGPLQLAGPLQIIGVNQQEAPVLIEGAALLFGQTLEEQCHGTLVAIFAQRIKIADRQAWIVALLPQVAQNGSHPFRRLIARQG